jgi:hypothetical protein
LDVLHKLIPNRLEREPLMTNNLKRVTVLGSAVLVLVVAATGTAVAASDSSDESPGFLPIQYAKESGSIAALEEAITGVTPDDALKQIVARLNDPDLATAEVRVVPETESSAGGRIVFLTVHTPESGPTAIKDLWLAELAAGALRDVLAIKNLAGLDNFQVASQRPDGEVVPVISGFGNVSSGQVFDTSSEDEITDRMAKGLRSVGLEPVSLTTANALQLSPIVVAKTESPASFVEQATNPRFWEQMLGDYLNYEGYYFELQDQDGKPAVISTAAHRAGTSASWTRSDLRRDNRMHPVITGSDGG